jgi:glyoxylase-like metal-dependent hydrolase (beta-lactamase superfamily II)
MDANARPSISDEIQIHESVHTATVELEKNIWRIVPPAPSGNVYVLKGRLKNVLIDTGLYQTFGYVRGELERIGLTVEEIDLVINTHEHFDHIGGNPFLRRTAMIAAHRSAATKIELQDEYVTHMKENNQSLDDDFSINIWLENRAMFDIGDYKLKILHTPGHTSGSIIIYEPFKHFMFTGDTVVKGEYLTPMLESGSAAEFVNSIERLQTLKIRTLYPGHGEESHDPDKELAWVNQAARERLSAFRESQSAGGKRRIKIRADQG